MQLTVELKEKDVEAFVSYHNSHLPHVVEERRKQRKEQLLTKAINAAIASVGPAITTLTWHYSLTAFLIGAGIAIGSSMMLGKLRDRRAIQKRKKQAEPAIAQYAKENAGGWQIKTDYSGVVVRRGGNSWRYHRDKIGRVVTIPGYTFVYLTDDWAFTIPHRAVSPADYKAFLQALADLFNTPFNAPALTFTPLEEARQTVGV